MKIAGAIAIIITITICLAYLLVVAKPLITGEANPANVTETIGTITGSMLSIVSLFVGAVAGAIGQKYYNKKNSETQENQDEMS